MERWKAGKAFISFRLSRRLTITWLCSKKEWSCPKKQNLKWGLSWAKKHPTKNFSEKHWNRLCNESRKEKLFPLRKCLSLSFWVNMGVVNTTYSLSLSLSLLIWGCYFQLALVPWKPGLCFKFNNIGCSLRPLNHLHVTDLAFPLRMHSFVLSQSWEPGF